METLYAGMELWKWILIGIVAAATGASLGFLAVSAMFSMRCAFCARPYAIWWRANGPCCRRCRDSIDKDVDAIAGAELPSKKPTLRIRK